MPSQHRRINDAPDLKCSPVTPDEYSVQNTLQCFVPNRELNDAHSWTRALVKSAAQTRCVGPKARKLKCFHWLYHPP